MLGKPVHVTLLIWKLSLAFSTIFSLVNEGTRRLATPSVTNFQKLQNYNDLLGYEGTRRQIYPLLLLQWVIFFPDRNYYKDEY